MRKFLEAKSPESEVRRLMETTEGYDPAVWKQMANELGLHGIHFCTTEQVLEELDALVL